MSKLLNLSNDEIVTRAKSCLRDDVKYRLEFPNGGADPTKPKPYDRVAISGHIFNVSDCIGVALWSSGISRHFTGTPSIPPFPDTPSISGSYINCASIVEECKGFKRRKGQPDYPGGRFFRKLDIPHPGCLVVYMRRNKPGHIGVVTHVPAEIPVPSKMSATLPFVDDWLKLIKVIHCSPSNERRFGRAVGETDGSVWSNKDAMFVELNREVLLRGTT